MQVKMDASPAHGKVQNINSYERITNSDHDNTPTRNTKWTRLTIANDGEQLRSHTGLVGVQNDTTTLENHLVILCRIKHNPTLSQ